MTCAQCRKDLTDALFGELSPAARVRFEAHLEACPDCTQAYRELRATLAVTARRTRPEPPEAFWNTFADRVEERLLAEEATSRRVDVGRVLDTGWARLRRRWMPVPTWAWQGMAAVLLVAFGVWIGHFSRSGPADPEPATLLPVSAETAAVQQRAGHYFDRSKVLLLGLVNTEPTTEGLAVLDLPQKQALAQELLAETPELQADLSAAGQQRLHELVADLELILRQIANLEAVLDVPAIELVQSSVDQRALLLKINLTEMRRAEAGVQPAVEHLRSPQGPASRHQP